MALAAHEIILRVSSETTSPFDANYGTSAPVAPAVNTADITGAKDVTLSNSADILDTTAFDDANAFRTKLSGLKDASMSFSANFEAGTALGSVKDFFDALSDGSGTAGIRHFFIGLTGAPGASNAGFAVTGIIESLEISGSVDGLVEASVSVQLSGEPIFSS